MKKEVKAKCENCGKKTPTIFYRGPNGVEYQLCDKCLWKFKEEADKKLKTSYKNQNKEKINHPSHYRKDSGFEAIDVIEAWNLDFCLGNALKYIARCGHKNDKKIEDLEKAIWYIERKIGQIKKPTV